MISLDTTTRIAYDSAVTATGKAQSVLSALADPVTVTVRDGNGNVMGTGSMVAPWATRVGSSLVVGEVSSFAVTAPGTPGTGWTLSFESGGRWVRGSFGPGSDFTWSLPTWAVNQVGMLGTVTLSSPTVTAQADLVATYTTQGTVGSAPRWVNFPASLTLTQSGTFNFAPYAVDDDGDVLAYSLVSPPSGYSINAATGLLTAGSTLGTQSVVVRATDPSGLYAEASCAVTVQTSQPGSLAHGQSFAVTGSGFGSKSAPLIVDRGNLSAWTGYEPTTAGGTYNLAWRAPHRGIALPHDNITQYLTGCHFGDGYSAGWDVMVWRTRTGVSYPMRTFASWYQRADSAWVFGLSGTPDSNYKCFQLDDSEEPYAGNATSNFEYNGRPTSLTAIPGWHLYNGGTPERFSPSNIWAGNATNPMSGAGHRVPGRVWVKIEWEVYHSTGTDGYARVWEDGVLKVNQSGRTALAQETQICVSIGGYSRDSGNANNWRYFADLFMDTNLNGGRFILANDATLDNATIREIQPWTSWSDSSVTLTCNKGALSTGTAHLHYVASGGTPTYLGTRTLA